MASDGMKRISLELGGHCPLLVFPDAPVEAAAKAGAYRAFRNMGQICNAINRVYVHQDIYAKIPDMLRYAIKKLQDRNLARQINWPKFLQAVEEQSGAPVDISR